MMDNLIQVIQVQQFLIPWEISYFVAIGMQFIQFMA